MTSRDLIKKRGREDWRLWRAGAVVLLAYLIWGIL